MFGLVLLSVPLSTPDLVTLMFQANKHPPPRHVTTPSKSRPPGPLSFPPAKKNPNKRIVY